MLSLYLGVKCLNFQIFGYMRWLDYQMYKFVVFTLGQDDIYMCSGHAYFHLF